ncbi:MAG TPA: ATP-binding protein [Chloroflexota bacterium]|nr:ATP-binding protein [Chloroflexota bacterium]
MQPAMGEQPDLFRLLVESVREYAIFLLDVEGHVRSWNAGAQRIKGYNASEIIGKHFSIFYPASELRRGKPEYELRVAIEEGRYEEEGWRVRSDGTRFWANVVITALRNRDGQLVGFAKVTRDLTERKQAEEERANLLIMERAARADAEDTLARLRSIQQVTEAALAHLNLDDLLRELLERIGDILAVDVVSVLLTDPDGRSLVPEAVRGLADDVPLAVRIPIGHGIVGQIPASRQGIIFNDLSMVRDSDPLLSRAGLNSLLGAPLGVERRVFGVLLIGTRRHRRFVETDLGFLQIMADRVALAIDRSRLYEAEQAARREAAQAGYAIRQRDAFLSVAAHELKTPVTSLCGLSEWLLRMSERGIPIDAGRHDRALTMMHRQAQNLSRLVTQLLEMTRLDADRLSLDRQDENLTELVRRSVDQAQTQTTEHQLILSAAPNVHAAVDAFRFEQVITNLLDNAIKYSPEGGPIEIELRQPRPERVRITVRDYGIGIPAGQEARIFERFFQAHRDSHRSGLGLGLYLSRQIVGEHGGRLTAESARGGGSRFIVDVPVASAVTAEGMVHA